MGSVYERYQGKFVQHGVNGAAISDLDDKATETLLENIGIDNTLQRKLIVQRIRGLKTGSQRFLSTSLPGSQRRVPRPSVRSVQETLDKYFRFSLPTGCVWGLNAGQIADRLQQPEVVDFLGAEYHFQGVDGLKLLCLDPGTLSEYKVPFDLRPKLWDLLRAHGMTWHNLCLQSLRGVAVSLEATNEAAIVPPALVDYQWEQTLSMGELGAMYLVWSVHSGQLLVAKLIQIGEGASPMTYGTDNNGPSSSRVNNSGHLTALRELTKLRKLCGVGTGHTTCLARPLDFEAWGKETLTMGTPFFWVLRKYYEGGNMARYIRDAYQPLLKCDRGLFWKWARQLATGLHTLHSNGVMHLGLMPENVLLTADLDVRLGEVGLACLMADIQESSTSGIYVAPEMLNNSFYERHGGSPTAMAADIWSAGVIYYEMATGSIPDLLSVQKLGEKTNMDPQAVTLIQRVMQRQPGARPSSKELMELTKQLEAKSLEDEEPPDPDGSLRLYFKRLERELPPYLNFFEDKDVLDVPGPETGAKQLFFRVIPQEGVPIFERNSKHLRQRGTVLLPRGLVVRTTGLRCLKELPRARSDSELTPSNKTASSLKSWDEHTPLEPMDKEDLCSKSEAEMAEFIELAPSYWLALKIPGLPPTLEKVVNPNSELMQVTSMEGLNIYSHHRMNSAQQIGYLPYGATVALAPARHVELFLGTSRVKISGGGWVSQHREYLNKEVQHFMREIPKVTP